MNVIFSVRSTITIFSNDTLKLVTNIINDYLKVLGNVYNSIKKEIFEIKDFYKSWYICLNAERSF